MSPRLAFALNAASRGGRLTLGYFQNEVVVDIKSDSSPVTAADRGAEELIRGLIADAYPDEEILGEEEGGAFDSPDRWIIDPIDGTKSFVSGVPLYSTLLSYERDFKPILGVVFFPALNEIFYAETGSGAFLNGRPIRVSSRPELKGSVICCGGHRSMMQRGRMGGLMKVADQAMATRTWSDAYGHALVACGRADAMIDPVVTRWDLSAVGLVVREAGGQFTSFEGGEVLTGNDGLEAISSNGLIPRPTPRGFSRVRAFAVDFGFKDIGIAVGEVEFGIGSARSPIRAAGALKTDAETLSRLAKTEGADLIVVGVPFEENGVEGRMARICKNLGGRLEELGWDVKYVDEALTSVQAYSNLREGGVSSRQSRDKVHGEAALLILERYCNETKAL